MKKLLNRTSLLTKYILANILLVFIPILLVIAIFYYQARTQIIKDYETTMGFSLQHTKNNIDSEIQDLEAVASKIAYDKVLDPEHLSNTNNYGEKTVVAINNLKLYFTDSGFFDEMLIYFHGDNFLFTNRGVYTFTEYSKTLADIDDKNDLKAILGIDLPYSNIESDNYKRITKADNTEYMLISFPCPMYSSDPYGILYGLVKIENIKKILQETNNTMSGFSCILDEDNQIILSYKNGFVLNDFEIQEIINGGIQIPVTLKEVQGDKYSIIATGRSEVNGWRYISIFPQAQIAEQMFFMQKSLLIAIFIIVGCCLFIGIVIAVRNYLPIRRLASMLNTYNSKSIRGNEIITIGETLQNIINNNNDMQRQLDETRLYLTQKLLCQILNGEADICEKDFQRQLEEENIHLRGPKYCVMIVHVPHKIAPGKREFLLEDIRSDSDFNAYGLDMIYKNYIAVLIDIKMISNYRNTVADMLQNLVYRRINIMPLIGIGQSYENIDMLRESLSEAISAVERLDVNSQKNILFFDNIKAQQESQPLWHPPQARNSLLQGLHQGNRTLIDSSINKLHHWALEQKCGFNSVQMRFITNGLVQSLIPFAEERQLANADQYVNQLIQYKGIDEFFRCLRAFSHELEESQKHEREKKNKELLNKIINYTDNHYSEQSISLSKIASTFDITTSYLSRFFHENVGCTYIEYLTVLRLKKAKHLLVETDILIKDIVEKVGYFDAASFTRKFKQVIGVSPRKYRQNKC